MTKKSQLGAIIKRLEAMMDSDSKEPQVRRFEVQGEERCIVTYYPGDNEEDGTFELKDAKTREVFQFDDIDLVTMDIYDLLEG